MSAIKISGIDPNINTITMQQNKTINSVNFSMYSQSKDSVAQMRLKEAQLAENRKKSTFKRNNDSHRDKNMNKSFNKSLAFTTPLGFQDESNDKSHSSSVSSSSGSKDVKLEKKISIKLRK